MATFGEIKTCVDGLEQALAAGDPEALAACSGAAAVFGRDTLVTYATAIARGSRHPEREALVDRALAPLAEAEAPPRRVFEVVGASWAPSGALDAAHPRRWPGLTVRGADGLVALRMDQAVAARAWGIGFASGDSATQEILDRAVEADRAERVAAHLRFLNGLHPRLDTSALRFPSPRDLGTRFEQLVLDVLNEERAAARRAPPEEDLFEKTDLRVHVPGLRRAHGARVQVTTITEDARLRSKLGRIPRAAEMVTVSPYTLACAAWGRAGTGAFPSAAAAEFFASVPTGATSVPRLALAIRTLLLSALDAPATPFGPMCAVPAPVRRFVRTFVDGEARRATAALRCREAHTGGRPFPRRMRTVAVIPGATPAAA